MPFIRITLTPPQPDIHAELARRTTALMADILGKRADLTAILVEDVAATWSIGGMPQPRAAHLEAIITAGSNSDAQKAVFLAAARDMLHDLCGALPDATYLVVRDIPATDWGYDGRTQLSRRHTPF